MWYLAIKLTIPGVESPIILALITLSITFFVFYPARKWCDVFIRATLTRENKKTLEQNVHRLLADSTGYIVNKWRVIFKLI